MYRFFLLLIGSCKSIKTALNIMDARKVIIDIFRYFSDRFRTTSNVLDDCFAAAVIEKLTEKELEDDIEMTEQQSIDL